MITPAWVFHANRCWEVLYVISSEQSDLWRAQLVA
jgi:hypothetical protein